MIIRDKRFNKSWLQAKYENKLIKTSFHILILPIWSMYNNLEFFLVNFGRILATENLLEKRLDFSTFNFNSLFGYIQPANFKKGWLGLSLGLVMVAWSLRICLRLRVCGRLPRSISPTKLPKLQISFASASVLLWPVFCIDGKANICLEESLLFVSGIIHLLFLSCDLQFFLVIEESRVF